ncbi:MAG: hypothetical protein AAF762_11930 [Pseudomonadota bacterium]
MLGASALLILLLGGLAFGLFDSGDDGGAEDSASPRGGTDGDDTVSGTVGNDLILLGAGDDTSSLTFNEGSYAGNDTIRGAAGADFIVDIAGANELYGDTGNDTIVAIDTGAGGADSVVGGFGADMLIGDDGDTLDGGPGFDQYGVVVGDPNAAPVVLTEPVNQISLLVQEDLFTDTSYTFNADTGLTEVLLGDQVVALIPGLQPGTIDFDDFEIDVTLTEEGQTVQEAFIGPVTGTADDDLISAPLLGGQVNALDGSDRVLGSAGNDNINLGNGADFYEEFEEGFGGDDRVSGGLGFDTIRDSLGSDTLLGGFGNDEIYAAGGLRLDEGALNTDRDPDVVDGGAGDDTITIDFGDTATGGDGADAFTVRVENPFQVQPVTITDFVSGEDTLEIKTVEDIDAASFLRTEVVDGDTVVLLENADYEPNLIVAVLSGVTSPVSATLSRI